MVQGMSLIGSRATSGQHGYCGMDNKRAGYARLCRGHGWLCGMDNKRAGYARLCRGPHGAASMHGLFVIASCMATWSYGAGCLLIDSNRGVFRQQEEVAGKHKLVLTHGLNKPRYKTSAPSKCLCCMRWAYAAYIAVSHMHDGGAGSTAQSCHEHAGARPAAVRTAGCCCG